jgi:hypothetical protein
MRNFSFLYSSYRSDYAKYVWAWTELSREYVLDDGSTSYTCKENYLDELKHVEEELAKENFMLLEK